MSVRRKTEASLDLILAVLTRSFTDDLALDKDAAVVFFDCINALQVGVIQQRDAGTSHARRAEVHEAMSALVDDAARAATEAIVGATPLHWIGSSFNVHVERQTVLEDGSISVGAIDIFVIHSILLPSCIFTHNLQFDEDYGFARFAICYLRSAICYLLFAICYLLLAICYLRTSEAAGVCARSFSLNFHRISSVYSGHCVRFLLVDMQVRLLHSMFAFILR
eukprot:SAG11_NODE_202_length_12550_cov_5.549835_4_plen_222_part_00